ncbi:MAG: PspC domain-containing protein [Bacillota bacterium]
MAEYLDLDPVLVRILFLLSLFIGGTGLLIYVVLAIIMPGPDYSQYNNHQPR